MQKKEHWKQIDKLVSQGKGYRWTNYYVADRRLFVLDPVRVAGQPRGVCRTLINRIKTDLSESAIKGLTLTGSGSRFVGSNLGVKALAFEPCDGLKFNVAQIEGIMLA